jgi:hypothetical protein
MIWWCGVLRCGGPHASAHISWQRNCEHDACLACLGHASHEGHITHYVDHVRIRRLKKYQRRQVLTMHRDVKY